VNLSAADSEDTAVVGAAGVAASVGAAVAVLDEDDLDRLVELKSSDEPHQLRRQDQLEQRVDERIRGEEEMSHSSEVFGGSIDMEARLHSSVEKLLM
jgi:hypothetical protein